MNVENRPHSKIFISMGAEVISIYVEEPVDVIETAIKDNHGQGPWYPGCGENPYWTNWTVKKSAIKSFLNLPEPKVNIDYGYNSDEF